MTDEQLAELRLYNPTEVARMLRIPLTRLETWAREDQVPHLRAGFLRGVEFTVEDLRHIDRKLPELTQRCGGTETGAPSASALMPSRPPRSRRRIRSGRLSATRPVSRTKPHRLRAAADLVGERSGEPL